MATRSASSAVESSSVPLGRNGPELVPRSVYLTSPRTVADSNIRHHIEACGDDNSVHLNDSLARALPLKNRLLGRIAHGKLVQAIDRKSTRLNSSHQIISYAVFCLKKKTP